MYRILLIIALSLFAMSAQANQNGVTITIAKHNLKPWQITYRTAQPVTRLTFVRNPDNSRKTRWQPLKSEFVVERESGIEFIARHDGRPFGAVTVSVSPEYFPLPKEYAPFTPFSDGGMVFHSGRFFACEEHCRQQRYTWKMTLIAPDGDNIIVGGQVYEGKTQWLDGGNGQKIYVGKAHPVSDGAFVSVIDTQLPEKLHHSLRDNLPGLIHFFSEKFGQLGYRPTLFASFSSHVNGGYGSQGGTLPGQIFMHWYGKKAIQPFDSQATYWFFAHEIAHLFQGEASQTNSPHQAWIHEGAADLFAGLASDSDYYYKRLGNAQRKCQKGLKKGTSFSQSVTQNPYLHYTCGLVIFDAIHTDLVRQKTGSVFELWQHYNHKVSQGAPATAATFLAVVSQYSSTALSQVLGDVTDADRLDVKKMMLLKGERVDTPEPELSGASSD